MANRARTIAELPALTTVSSDDLMVVVDNPATSANTMKVTVATLFNTSNANITVADTATLTANTFVLKNTLTPANSSATPAKGGTIFYDSNYLYIAVSNNVVKRVALSSF